jgi:hypothetical protein
MNKTWKYEVCEGKITLNKFSDLVEAMDFAEGLTENNDRELIIQSRAKTAGFANVSYSVRNGLAA